MSPASLSQVAEAHGIPLPCSGCGSFQREQRRKGPHLGEYCTSCGKHQRWLPKDVTLDRAREFVMPFGKHKGKKLKDIDDEYLDWLYENCERRKISDMAKLVYDSRPAL